MLECIDKRNIVFSEGGRKASYGPWSSPASFFSFCPQIDHKIFFFTCLVVLMKERGVY